MPGIISLWIVGRSGGLVFNKDFVPVPPMDFNDKLRLASQWFGMCSIAAQLSPAPGSSGVLLLEADGFEVHSFTTLTGTTFLAVTEPGTADAPEILRSHVYMLYCDYVLKNPFHEMDQVVKSEAFDANLGATVGGINRRWGYEGPAPPAPPPAPPLAAGAAAVAVAAAGAGAGTAGAGVAAT